MQGQVNNTAGRLCEAALATAQASMDAVNHCCAGPNPLPLAAQQKVIQRAQDALTKTVKTVGFARRLVRLSSINAELQNMQELRQKIHSRLSATQLGGHTQTCPHHVLVDTSPLKPVLEHDESSEVASSAGQDCDDTTDSSASR